MTAPNNLLMTRKRLLIIVVSIIFLFCVLFGRLAYIQLYQGAGLQSKAAEQWYRDLPLQAPRGMIYDANGDVLADNTDVFTVYVRPNAVKDQASVASVLAEQLGVDRTKLLESITTSRVSEITVKREVPPETAHAIKAMNLDGVYFSMDSKRNYPEGNFLTQILGFTNIDNVGQNGLEGYYDQYLKGINGFSYTAADIKGVELENSVTRYVPAIPGSSITLTVDATIQSFAESAVMDAMQEFQAKSASMIVMDSKSGAVLGMANTPAFDLNDIPRDDINLLNALSKNTMIVDVFEPGSTFKIFTTALALEHGLTNYDANFYCPGYRLVDGQRIRCWRSIGHGSQKLPEGVKNSCNCVFMDLAQKLGTAKFYNGLRDFGFGAKTNIDFFGESRGILMNEKNVKTVDLARIGFGQAVAVTPLQLITGVCAAINGGKLFEPYFVSSVDTYDGKNIYSRKPKEVRRVLSEDTSAKMRELLGLVVSEGSGKKAQVAGFNVGGKTGTAQKYENGIIAQGKYVSSFIGFSPVDNPEYVVLMIVNEPSGYLYYGSMVAAPYAGQVLGKIFNYKGMVPSQPVDTELVIMPELADKPLSEAVSMLRQLGLQYELVGEKGNVKSTIPAATTQIPKGDIVLIRLSG